MSTEIYYITEEGKQLLEAELQERETSTRKEIADTIASAKDQGDLSENFEYQDAKERQAQNETRIIQLRDMLSRSQIIEKNENSNEIGIGTEFEVELPDGKSRVFSIVGATETNPMEGRISNESPLGQAFLGKKAGEDVSVDLPSGTMTYKVIKLQ